MHFLSIWILTIFILLLHIEASPVVGTDQPTAGHGHHNHHNLFATKTTYQQAYHKLLNNENQVRDYRVPDQCKPKMLYLICRHATRYPSKKKASRMQEKMYTLRDKIVANNNLSADLIERFKQWQLRMQIHDDNRITDTGFQETRVLARRIKETYPEFFDLNRTNLTLYTTYKPRTNETAYAFFDEIFEKNYKFEPVIKKHLWFHSDCKQRLLDNGVQLQDPKAVDDLIESDAVQRMRRKLAKVIGIDENEFDFKSMKLIYIVCSFEYAIYNDTLWCNLFSKADFQVMEYIIDLQSYLIGGHGRAINQRMACPVLVDLMQHLDESRKAGDRLTTSLQFSHSGIFKRVYAMFGLFKEFGSSLCRSSFQCRNEWRSSLILPFLANIKFILYDCSGGSSSPDHRLMVKIQEHFVKIDGCDDLLCPLSSFMARYREEAEHCDLDEICRI